MSNVSEPFDPGAILYTHEARARLDWLEAISAEQLTDFEADERDDLKEFKKEVIAQWGEEAWKRDLSLVLDSYWDKYADSAADDLYGEATNTIYWDEERWASDLQEQYSSVKFAGTEYWGDGQR